MCFYDEPDWNASIYEDNVLEVTTPVRCDECRRMIQPGEFRRHIFMQEYEVCRQDPDSDDYDGPETDAPGCGHASGDECDFGEYSSYDRCLACDQLIEAIHRHELDEGCDDDESRPNLTELHDAMNEGDGAAYLAKAEELYPGITGRLPENFIRSRQGAGS